MPVIGFGVFQNPNCKPACLAALQSGYRSVSRPPSHCSPSNLRCKIRRHIDSARAYRNEAQVGDAVRESGVSREDIFISLYLRDPGGRMNDISAQRPKSIRLPVVTKVASMLLMIRLEILALVGDYSIIPVNRRLNLDNRSSRSLSHTQCLRGKDYPP
jgi:hypothetical protein